MIIMVILNSKKKTVLSNLPKVIQLIIYRADPKCF